MTEDTENTVPTDDPTPVTEYTSDVTIADTSDDTYETTAPVDTNDTTCPEDTGIDTTEPDIGDDTTAEPTLTEAEIKEIIDKNLDIILPDGELLFSEQEYIDAQSDAFAEIVSLGENALPYLEEVSLKTGGYYDFSSYEAHRSLIAKTAAYTINPELYDLITPSSNGKYAIALRVGTFFYPEWGGSLITAYNKAEIIDCTSNESIFSANTSAREYGQYTNVSVEWSPDNAYAAIHSSDNKFYSTTEIYDVKNAKSIPLPSVNDSIIPRIASELNLSGDINFDYISISLDSWLKNNAVTVKFMFRYGNAFIVQGTYIYNIYEQSILSLTCKLSEDIAE